MQISQESKIESVETQQDKQSHQVNNDHIHLNQPLIQQSLENTEDIKIEKILCNLCNLCDSDACLHNKPIVIKNGERIRKIDIHSHILPNEIPDFRKQFGYGGFITLKAIPDNPDKMQMWKDNIFFREVDDKCFSA